MQIQGLTDMRRADRGVNMYPDKVCMPYFTVTS
jgi:hypothetical protein